MERLQLAITADLHWGHNRGNESTLRLLAHLKEQPPDVLILAGDQGAGEHFRECLALFDDLPCRKAQVPGNHDIWVSRGETRFDSLDLYQKILPQISLEHHFHPLDLGPMILIPGKLALVGSMNWYDYSWSIAEIRQRFPEEEERLESKRFTKGRHNDANFVRWPLNDLSFTSLVRTTLERHIVSELVNLMVRHHV